MNEFQTRKNLIDKQLERAKWLKQYIKEEINSVKSDFKKKNYVPRGPTIEKGVDRFVDYVLLAQDSSVLAIIEAKRFSKNAKDGELQARVYREDVEKQIEYKVPIFLTNGEKWFYIDQKDRVRKVSGPFSQFDLERR